MKDKNGIEIKCANCHYQNRAFRQCLAASLRPKCENGSRFEPTRAVIEARIAELQEELTVVQESERAEAKEADRLRAEVKELKAHKEILEQRIQEFSMELLDRMIKENKDVLERLKEAESEEK